MSKAFGAAVRAFVGAMRVQLSPVKSRLHFRIQARLRFALSPWTVTTEEFHAQEQPNVQVVMDTLLANAGRTATLLGVEAAQERVLPLGHSRH